MFRSLALVIVVLIPLSIITTAAAPTAPRIGDSNGCTGTATYDVSHGNWYMACGGNSCGANNNRPCTQLPGGLPGANFTFCGCQDGVPQTPLCCFACVDTSTGLPFGNGLCYGQGNGQPPIGNACTKQPPCNAVYKQGSTTEKIGQCQGPPPPEPH